MKYKQAVDIIKCINLPRGAHSKYFWGVLFDLGPTFMFVSDKCTDVYPAFLQVPKPTQLKIQM